METRPATSPLCLSSTLSESIGKAGTDAYPDECCGILIGRDVDGLRVVERLLLVENAAAQDDRPRRFIIQPADLLAAEKSASATGQSVIGFYHSHPDHPARPSVTDREAAWPFYSYIITSVTETHGSGHVLDMTSWVLNETTGAFVRQDIIEQ